MRFRDKLSFIAFQIILRFKSYHQIIKPKLLIKSKTNSKSKSFCVSFISIFKMPISDRRCRKSVLVQSVCEGFGLPSCNDLGLQFLFFCQSRRVALKLDQSNPAKSFICSDLHQDKPTQFSVN